MPSTGLLDRDREGRLRGAVEQVQKGLLEVGVLLAAFGIVRRTSASIVSTAAMKPAGVSS